MSVLGAVKKALKTAPEALLWCERIACPAADLTLLVDHSCTDVVSAEEEASKSGTDRADRADWI